MKGNRRCLDPAEMDRLDASARAHIEECPRCHALHASYLAYIDSPEIPAGARIEEARSTLDALIDAQYGAPAPPPVRGWAERRSTRLKTIGRRRWILWGFAPAVCAVALVFVLIQHSGSDRERPMTFRGAPGSHFTVYPAEARSDGTLALRWRAVARATRYRVRLYDSDLRFLQETTDQADTELVFNPGGTPRVYRVIAYGGTMKLAESEVGTIGSR